MSCPTALRNAIWKCETCGFIQVNNPSWIEQPPVCRRCLLGEWPDIPVKPMPVREKWVLTIGGALIVYAIGVSVALWVCSLTDALP